MARTTEQRCAEPVATDLEGTCRPEMARRPRHARRLTNAMRRVDARKLIDLGFDGGLAAVGVTSAEVFADTRKVLVDRKERSLAAGMQFTYRNPGRSTDPARTLPSARSLVVGALSYRVADPTPESGGPDGGGASTAGGPRGEVARYVRSDYYAALRTALSRLAAELESEGWRATVVCDDNALVDRAAAHRAGLGFFGKNTLLLLPGLGSWFVLGTVVTDAPLSPMAAFRPRPGDDDASTRPASTPSVLPHGSGCHTCSKCMTACPTGALVEPGVLDARRCLAWLVQAPGPIPPEHREAMGGRIYGCDECQVACPLNKVADRRSPPAASAQSGSVELLAILTASDETLLTRFGRWYVPERNPRYLRRNALVALGNVGDPAHPGTVEALRSWSGSDDELLAEHGRWAAARLGIDVDGPAPAPGAAPVRHR